MLDHSEPIRSRSEAREHSRNRWRTKVSVNEQAHERRGGSHE